MKKESKILYLPSLQGRQNKANNEMDDAGRTRGHGHHREMLTLKQETSDHHTLVDIANVAEEKEWSEEQLNETIENILSLLQEDDEQAKYYEVAVLLRDSFKHRYPSTTVFTALFMWVNYAFEIQPRVHKPSVMVAAMDYLFSTLDEGEAVSQQEIARRYDVSVAQLARRSQALVAYIETFLSKLNGDLSQSTSEANKIILEDDGYDEREHEIGLSHHAFSKVLPSERLNYILNHMLNDEDIDTVDDVHTDAWQEVFNQKVASLLNSGAIDQYEPKTRRQKAQMLLYDAWEAPTPREQKRLAKKALEIYPDAADAYVIFAEHANSLKKAHDYYLKGVQAGERDLGPEFFREKRGEFWGWIETRPYMRALAGYAETLYYMGRPEEAIKTYEAMLDLNPNDNQGVRYPLITAYLELEQYAKANRLLQRYIEDSAFYHFNRILIEYHLHGFTFKLKFKKLLTRAHQQNPYVIPYLLEEVLLPDVFPELMSDGDENEAIIYAMEHMHLWHEEEVLMEWLEETYMTLRK
ncbi:MAG: hypothetical protein BSOLF_1380 [Candidatus Carbobacillus altaicus]|uniref:Uncharacterized protein n=1 Tax=Candidatus Carbonibacillus altaicus TaxID=2163959 RepID=A0A2R6Y4C3_9BACL|nr:MAG: hypothetical protein BSOLF_1380 [Candidatus Carbobacillus altaicus]